MARSRVETQEETRRKILDAAHREFSERRVGDVSVQAIATRAGYTKGAVYSNFDSKIDLLFAVVERRMRERGADYVDIVVGEPDSAVGKAVGARAGSTQRGDLGYFRLVAAIWAEAVHDPSIADRYAELRRQHRRRLADAIQARADELGLRLKQEPIYLATGLIGMSMATMLEALIDPEVPVDAVHGAMAEVVLAGILSTAEPAG